MTKKTPTVLPGLAAILMAATPGWVLAMSSYLSPEQVITAPGANRLFITEPTANQVVAASLPGGKVVKTFKLDGPPSGLAVSPDGKRLFVTDASPKGKVHVINAASGKIERAIPLGHTPVSPVASPNGRDLFVCVRFENAVSFVDLKEGKETGRVPAVREPIAAAVTPDGALLVVANHLPAGAVDGDYAAATISLIDVKQRKRVKDFPMPNGSSSLRDVAISPDGKFAYVTHILGRYHLPTTQLERGWMNTNALTIIDLANRTMVNTVLLDEVDRGAANPWGVACSKDGKWVCVAHAGTHEVSVIDRAALHAKLDKVAAGEAVTVVSKKPEDVPNDLSFLVDLRRRLKLAGNGPRGIAVAGGKAYAAEYFSDALGVVELDPAVRHRPKSLPLGPEPKLTQARQGEIFFHDADLCFQNWQSCSSCHPDTRADALNWDLLNDGMGNPKQTKSLIYSHVTPPSMMSGARGTAEDAVRSGIRVIQFIVRPEEDAAAIDEYLKALRPVPGPHLKNGTLSQAAQRGKQVFEDAGCAACHSGKYYTNLEAYDVGTAKGLDAGKEYDTPTLVEVWRTAPYLHDGRAATLMDMFTTHNPGDKHGKTSNLSQKQLADLVEFVSSL